MRLIDADNLILHLSDFMMQESPIDVQDIESINVCAVIKECIKAVEERPTAYDVDKVVEQLEEEKECAYADFEFYAKDINLDEEYDDYYHCGLSRAIDIVKRGGVEWD